MFLASKKILKERMPSWHPPDSDSGMVRDDESTIIKVNNDANACFFRIPLDYFLHPQNHHNPLHSVVSRLHPPPVEYVGYSKHASFTDTVTGIRHSVGSIATPSTTYFAVRFAAAHDDAHEFRWCSWLPRNGRHHVIMFLHFPSIISQL